LALERGLPSGFAPTALAISPDEGRLVLAAGVEGLYRSTAGGAAWAEVRVPLPPVTALLFAHANPGVVLAGTELRGNYRSLDGGRTWRAASSGLPRDRYGCVPGAVQFVQHPRDRRVVFMGASAGVRQSFAGVPVGGPGGRPGNPPGAPRPNGVGSGDPPGAPRPNRVGSGDPPRRPTSSDGRIVPRVAVEIRKPCPGRAPRLRTSQDAIDGRDGCAIMAGPGRHLGWRSRWPPDTDAVGA
jgi:hypothetical protein